jgi:hypothetical protein
MTKMPKITAIISIIAGVIMIVAGVFTWYIVQRELKDEKITVSDDAENFAGDPVDGPLTAYSQAMVIKEHALEIGGGKTYAELPQDDPKRATVANAAFLRASLFTSVVSFGVAALVAGLGLLFILLGLGFLGLDKKVRNMRFAGLPPEAAFREEPAPDVVEAAPLNPQPLPPVVEEPQPLVGEPPPPSTPSSDVPPPPLPPPPSQ